MKNPDKLFLFALSGEKTPEAYDEAALAACLQGLYNRENGPAIYLLSKKNPTPRYWLDKFTANSEMGWLGGRETAELKSIGELCELAKPLVKKIILWDKDVDASFNVAFTIAGVEDGAVLSPDYYERMRFVLDVPEVVDLRGRFTGEISGSKKNDAYIWAVENYLKKGLCSKHWLCLYSDPFKTRETGEIGYVNTRDWCVYNRAFVYDLSPWGDEAPLDDPDQTLGRDLETYKLILACQLEQTKGEQMTEIAGFFNFVKYSNVPGHESSSHEPVPTEWESVFIMSPYNCYQNTVASDCYNQSLHSQYPFVPIKQSRPAQKAELENACYLGIQMCDYDSATPLYDFMYKHWDDPRRGEAALSWGINPNLIESYPDIITYFYKTAKKDKDVFVADASAAGYFNPSRIQEQYWDMVVKHNRHFYDLTDMTMTPMVLDWEPLSDEVLDQMIKFSPDGLAWIIMNFHADIPQKPEIKIHGGVMTDEMLNHVCNGGPVDEVAKSLAGIISGDVPKKPAFHYIRIVWQSPGYIIDIVETLKKLRPDLDIRLVNTYDYFRLNKQFREEMENEK
ncbi:MAG: hypothetical protein FWD23_09390 [Oscillospiraceae bacterium]|nr:hypothetical protein [Oscillospiraceae bacterium]